MTRSAVEIARFYEMRWPIELLFLWLKQNLEPKTLLGRSETAVRRQILAAMIAFLLLRIVAKTQLIKTQPIRFAELVVSLLHVRKPRHQIDKPPKVNPSKRHPPTWWHNPAQAERS